MHGRCLRRLARPHLLCRPNLLRRRGLLSLRPRGLRHQRPLRWCRCMFQLHQEHYGQSLGLLQKAAAATGSAHPRDRRYQKEQEHQPKYHVVDVFPFWPLVVPGRNTSSKCTPKRRLQREHMPDHRDPHDLRRRRGHHCLPGLPARHGQTHQCLRLHEMH